MPSFAELIAASKTKTDREITRRKRQLVVVEVGFMIALIALGFISFSLFVSFICVNC